MYLYFYKFTANYQIIFGMDLQDKLFEIDAEISKGLKLRAADRLKNLLGHYPDEPQIWLKLAELYYEAGFYDAAGKYWILTEPNEERIKKCVEMYEKSVNYSGNQILKELIFRGDKSKLSEYGQRKLEALEFNSKQVAGTVPTYKRKNFSSNIPSIDTEQTLKSKITDKVIIGLILLAIMIVIISVIAGFIDGFKIVWNMLFT